MDREKLIRQLFVGKVSDVLGIDKTTELLNESIQEIDSIEDNDAHDFPNIPPSEPTVLYDEYNLLYSFKAFLHRLAVFIAGSLLYIAFLPYTSVLAVIGISMFIISGDFTTEHRLNKFSNWFNSIVDSL